MIVPFSWMWEQLNGPNISAIKDALYAYLYEQFNIRLDSLNDLSIDTADSALLTVFGMLMGVPRPIVIRQSDNNRMMFASSYYNPTNYGFSEKSGQWHKTDNIGGTFAQTWETGEDSGDYAPTNWYRAVLKAYAGSDGRMGSLTLLDDIVTAIREVDTQGAIPDHRFEFFTNTDDVHAAGDFDVFLTTVNGWSDIDIASTLLESLIYGGYAPVPRGVVSMDPDLKTSTLLDEAVRVAPTLDKYIPPKGWTPIVNISSMVSVGTVLGKVIGTLEDGSEVEIDVKSDVDGMITYLPANVNNWLQPFSIYVGTPLTGSVTLNATVVR